jgi:hypothetical protein
MAAKKRHPNPVVAAFESYGQKMLSDLINGGVPGVIDGVLADVDQVAEEVSKRTKTARGRIAARKRR